MRHTRVSRTSCMKSAPRQCCRAGVVRGAGVSQSNERIPLCADDSEVAAEIDPDTHQFPFYVPEKPGERTYADVDWCEGSLEPSADAVQPIDPAYRALFVVGAQKAGTTWLHNALATHPAMVQGETRIACESIFRRCAVACSLAVLSARQADSHLKLVTSHPSQDRFLFVCRIASSAHVGTGRDRLDPSDARISAYI